LFDAEKIKALREAFFAATRDWREPVKMGLRSNSCSQQFGQLTELRLLVWWTMNAICE
jgi:hypothetical protein